MKARVTPQKAVSTSAAQKPAAPKKAKTPKAVAAAPAVSAEEIAESAIPMARVPFGSHRQKLAREARPGFRRYWFNDEPGRVDAAKEAGYTHVLDNKGRPETYIVDKKIGGGGRLGYLMEIPEELFKQDMADQQREVDVTDDQIRKGKLAAKPGDQRYVPEHGISIR